jgi:NADH-quinone oxidoreductase subunit G
MMRLVQAMDADVPVINLDELRAQVARMAPQLDGVWSAEGDIVISTARNKDAVYLPAKKPFGPLDVVSRYSLYREGAWARASKLLLEAGRLHALDDVIAHPDTLPAGEQTVKAASGNIKVNVGNRTDVAPGVLFVAKRGVAGDLSSELTVDVEGGAA